MSKIAVVYWSGTGNTKEMADMVAKGSKAVNAEVSIYTASEFSADLMDSFDAVAFGCPSMGSEQLEESEFEPMFSSCKDKLKDKSIALFGSYGWGSGEWMKAWEEVCNESGAKIVHNSVICNEAPDDEAASACMELGKALV